MSEAETIMVNGKTLDEVIKELQEHYNLVGRENELKMCLAAKLADMPLGKKPLTRQHSEVPFQIVGY